MSNRRNKLAIILSAALIVISALSLFVVVPKSLSVPQSLSQAPPATALTNPVTLHARGASFPNPLIQVWAQQYHKEVSNVTLSYTSVGSGKGQNALFNKTDDFDASDAPLSTTQQLLAPNVLHIPETIGSVVVAYNLPSPIPQNINLTGDIVARVYLGKILFWNDSAIQALNPHVTFPNQQIITVHRFDSSGTTFVFTSFLCLDSPVLWCQTVGNGTSVPWPGSPTGTPIALNGNTNSGVAQVISSKTFSLGYLELNYALTTPNVHYANIANKKGVFVTPTLQTTSNAVGNSTATLPPGSGDWSHVSLLNAPGNQTYPIASFTYFLVYKELNVVPSMDINETIQKDALVQFLYWAVNAGQQNSTKLAYVPLPQAVRTLDNASIASITLTINSTTVPRSYSLSASSAGWNGIVPGPTLVAYSGDPVTLTLSASDTLTHQFFIDFNNDLALEANETASTPFTTGTTFSFTPLIGVNIPVSATGNYTYRDLANPNTVYGTIRILPQQAAAAIPVANSLKASTGTTPGRDSSLLTTIGSLVVDLRALNVSGSITLVSVDSSSGVINLQPRTFQISKLSMYIPGGLTTFQAKFLLNAHVSPYDLSSDVIVVLNPNGLTASAARPQATRELDMGAHGAVNINDASVLVSAYGSGVTTPPDPRYNPLADFLATNHVNIFDVAIFENFWQAPVYR